MGLRSGASGDSGRALPFAFMPWRPAEPIDERDVPEEARAALARMVGQCETIEMLVDFGAPVSSGAGCPATKPRSTNNLIAPRAEVAATLQSEAR